MTPLKITIVTKGLRQYEVAERAGIDETLLSMYCTGRREMSRDHLRKIARVLKVSQRSLKG